MRKSQRARGGREHWDKKNSGREEEKGPMKGIKSYIRLCN